MLLNLLINAAQAIEGGRRRARLDAARRGDEVEIAVSDTGCGIPGERARAHLRPVLHDQAGRRGHRPRPLDLPRDRPPPRRPHPRRLGRRPRHRGPDPPAGRSADRRPVGPRSQGPARRLDSLPPMPGRLRTITPIDGSVYVERPLADRPEIARDGRARAVGAGATGAACRSPSAPRSSRAASTRSSRAATRSRARSPGRWAGRSRTRRASCAASRSARAR